MRSAEMLVAAVGNCETAEQEMGQTMSKPGSNSTKSSIANLPSVLMMVVVLIFLALALWNWRETGWPGLVWLAAAILMTVIRSPHSARNSRNEIVKHRKDVSEQVLLFLMFLTMMVLPVVHLGTRVFSFADFELPWQASAAGAALQPLALWLFWRSHADLGRNWSPTLEVRSEHALVSSGVYSRMRHPMYAAIWLFALTQTAPNPELDRRRTRHPCILPDARDPHTARRGHDA